MMNLHLSLQLNTQGQQRSRGASIASALLVCGNQRLIEEPENHRNFTGVSPALMLECVMT
jgi:hypothetical protein